MTSVAVLSRHWGRLHDEEGFVIRGVAAAVSRLAPVEILTPGRVGSAIPDGAFDRVPIGAGRSLGDWPAPDDCRWPARAYALAITEELDRGAALLVARDLPGTPLITVGGPPRSRAAAGGSGVPVTDSLLVGVPEGPPTPRNVGLQVPVNPLATSRPHVGLGFVDYLLVLSDRTSALHSGSAPTPLAAWMAARFADRHVVVVEQAVASVWRWRSLRGAIHVDSRMDLWRLMAHAHAVVDLSPGPLIARECVEALRYGVPIVVPDASSAAPLARKGGGLWFADPAELLTCVEALDDPPLRHMLGSQGQAVADDWYGDGLRFVERMRATVGAWLA